MILYKNIINFSSRRLSLSQPLQRLVSKFATPIADRPLFLFRTQKNNKRLWTVVGLEFS